MSDGPQTTICWTLWNMERGVIEIREFLKNQKILRSELHVEAWSIQVTIEGAHEAGPELHAYYHHVTGDVQEQLL